MSAAIRGGRARRGMRRECRWSWVGRRLEALLRQSGKAARDLCLERSLVGIAGPIAAGSKEMVVFLWLANIHGLIWVYEYTVGYIFF